MRIAIVVKGLEKAPDKLRRFRMGIMARTQAMLAAIGETVRSISVDDYLSGPRPQKLGRVSGDLARKGTGVDFKVQGSRVVIGTNLRYGKVHEKGATIFPRSAKNLVFQLRSGEWRASKRVVIPARPFLSPAVIDAIPETKSIIARHANEVLREAMA